MIMYLDNKDIPFRDRTATVDLTVIQADKGNPQIKDNPDPKGSPDPNKDKGSDAQPCGHKVMQGISVKSTHLRVGTLLPFISSKGIKTVSEQGHKLSYVNADSKVVSRQNLYVIDHGLELNQFGVSTARTVTRDNVSVVAFNDISSLNDPVQYLKDDGMTAYPQVYLDPDWLSPNAMNGVIEPLEIRGTIAGATVESPFVARTVRGSLMDRVTPYYRNESFNRGVFDRDVAFIDSQELSFSKEAFRMFKEPIGDFGRSKISPYDETLDRKISNDLQDHFTNDDFSDTVGVGVISRGASTTMSYNQGKVVDRGETGIRNRNNVESIAFGGLLK